MPKETVKAWLIAIIGIFVMLLTIVPAKGQQNTLILVVDASSSISDEEMELQMQGYLTSLQAFPYFDGEHIEVLIFSNSVYAVSSGSYYDALEFFQNPYIPESVYRHSQRSRNSTTCVEEALIHINENWDTYPGFVTIDIAVDGSPNCAHEIQVETVANQLHERHAVINVLVIDPQSSSPEFSLDSIVYYYEQYVINGFVLTASSFEDFAQALRRKIGLEMSYLLE
jgi:hypothetical protein